MRLTPKRKLLLLLVCVVVAVLVAIASPPSGPSYQGKPIKGWFYEPGNNDSAAFSAMGRRAVPFLVERLEDAPSDQVKVFLGSLSSIPREIYRQRKQMWQHRAAYLLGEMGADAQAAETNLASAAASQDWSLRGAAKVALMKIRNEPLEPLIEKLRDTSDWQAWYQNSMMVGQFRARAEPAIPILLDSLQHTNNIIQAHALIALGMIARQPEKCIPALAPFLRSPSIGDRQKAMSALLAFGTNAQSSHSCRRPRPGPLDPHQSENRARAPEQSRPVSRRSAIHDTPPVRALEARENRM